MEHIPVLAKEVIEYLDPKPNENFIDATLGFGGHAALILEKTSPNGKLMGIDQDPVALGEAQKKLAPFDDRVFYYRGNFVDLGLVIRDWDVKNVDGILIDLGVSTYQLTDENRGFSFNTDSFLDMRMDPERQHLTAADVINKYSEKELSKIFFELGEEKFSRPIAKKIVEIRYRNPIERTIDLVEIIKTATPPSYRIGKKTHFATNVFRALRMYVNDELGVIKQILPQAVQVVSPGGKIAVITFHSLEDRIVKNFFRDQENLEIVTKKPVGPSDEEVKINPKSRSAKLRVARKII